MSVSRDNLAELRARHTAGKSGSSEIHTPSLDGKPLLSTKEFSMAKPGIRIVNCARGNLIDDDALIEAIKSKQVAQAALDVYAKEPLSPDSPLLTLDEIICTPHLGASTEEAQEKVAIAVADQIVDFFGCLGRTMSQFSDFCCNNRKSLPVFSSTCCFHRRIQGQ